MVQPSSPCQSLFLISDRSGGAGAAELGETTVGGEKYLGAEEAMKT